MTSILHDLRHSARRLRRNWRLSALVIGILTIGIGAAAAVFSLADALVLRPLPFDEPERLVKLWGTNPGRDIQRFSVSGDDYADWRERSESFEELAAVGTRNVSLTGRGEPVRLSAAFVTPPFFDVFRAEPAVGRAFDSADVPVAVISDDLSRRLFPDRSDVRGQTLRLDDVVYEVVGVMPGGFRFPNETDLWAPLQLRLGQGGRDDRNYDVFGRLASGATLSEARADMDLVAGGIAREFPEQNAGWGAFVEPLGEWLVPTGARTALWLLLGAVGLVMAVVCANVAGLLLADAERRRQEFTVRAAMGAGRGRLMRAALVESLILGLAGGLGGIFIAAWAVELIPVYAAETLPLLDQVRLDWRVLSFCAAASLLTSLVFGVVPALRVARRDLQSGLRESGRALSDGRGQSRARSVLTVAQIGVACALLIGAVLSLRSLDRLFDAPLGFETEKVLTFSTAPPFARYPTQGDWVRYHREVLEKLRASPLVESAGATSGAPLSRGNTSINFGVNGPSALAPGETLQVDWRILSPGFFETLGVPIVSGRDFRESDGADDSVVPIVISQATARRLWPNEDALDRELNLGSARVFRVIGVAGDVRESDLAQAGDPTVYIPYAYWRWGATDTVVRYRGDAAAAIRLARETVAEVDAELPVFGVRTMEEAVEQSAGRAALTSGLLGAFAAVAVLLAMLGLYGLLTFNVESRTNEFGVRLALGASPGSVLQSVMSRTTWLLAAGLAVGLPGGWALARGMRAALYETSPNEAGIYLLVAGLLAVIAGAGSLQPALKAARVDPATALRHD